MKTIQVLKTNFSACFILDFFLICKDYFSECWKTKGFFLFFKDWNMLFCDVLQDFLPQIKQKWGEVDIDG